MRESFFTGFLVGSSMFLIFDMLKRNWRAALRKQLLFLWGSGLGFHVDRSDGGIDVIRGKFFEFILGSGDLL